MRCLFACIRGDISIFILRFVGCPFSSLAQRTTGPNTTAQSVAAASVGTTVLVQVAGVALSLRFYIGDRCSWKSRLLSRLGIAAFRHRGFPISLGQPIRGRIGLACGNEQRVRRQTEMHFATGTTFRSTPARPIDEQPGTCLRSTSHRAATAGPRCHRQRATGRQLAQKLTQVARTGRSSSGSDRFGLVFVRRWKEPKPHRITVRRAVDSVHRVTTQHQGLHRQRARPGTARTVRVRLLCSAKTSLCWHATTSLVLISGFPALRSGARHPNKQPAVTISSRNSKSHSPSSNLRSVCC